MFEKEGKKYRLNLVSKLKEKIQKGYNCKELVDIEKAFQKGATIMYKDLCKAKACLEQLVSEITVGELEVDPNILQQAEQFLKEEPQSKWVNPVRTTNDNQIKLSEVEK